jgi:hypothetical protein
MGSTFSSITNHSYPCQLCGTIFKREISGTLLCSTCKCIQSYDRFNSFQKEICILSSSIYPRYEIIKNKKPILILVNSFESGSWQSIYRETKNYFLENHISSSRIKWIKRILKQFDTIGLFQKYKGIYFHTLQSNDLLFVHHPSIQDKDQIIHLDLDQLEKKIAGSYVSE